MTRMPNIVEQMLKSETESEENEDRLSDLHDSLILHILSFLNPSDAVQTCVLSTRWKHLWKYLPSLKLRPYDFKTRQIFSEFVSRVLSLRDASFPLQTLYFVAHDSEIPILETVLSYAVSHNVQRLQIRANFDGDVPRGIFSFQNITYLTIVVNPDKRVSFPESLNLPALTSLIISYFVFSARDNGNRAEPFSGCKRLKDLTVKDCVLMGDAKVLCISNATISSLGIRNRGSRFYEIVGFDRYCYCYEIKLCTPSVRSFAFEGVPLHRLSGSNVSSIEQVDIDSDITQRDSGSSFSVLLDWLKGFTNVKLLTVNASTLQFLIFMLDDLLNIKFAFLRNLKSMKVKMAALSYRFVESWGMPKSVSEESIRRGAAACDETVKFLLRNSPSAEIVFI